MDNTVYFEAADAVLAALGIAPTAANVDMLAAWSLAEWGGTSDLTLTNNPMADTAPAPDATAWNSAGVKVYPSLDVGARATAATLHNGLYPTLLGGLQASDPSAFFSDEGLRELGVWAGGSGAPNYGYAANVQSIYAALPPPPAWALVSHPAPGGSMGTLYTPPVVALGLAPVLVGVAGLALVALGAVLIARG